MLFRSFKKVLLFKETSKLAGAETVTSAVKLLPLTEYDCDDEGVPVIVVIAFKVFVDKLILGTPTASIVNVCAFEIAAPFATVMLADPADVMSAAKIEAVTCVDETNVVDLLLPFQRTTLVPFTKPLPLTVSVKPPDPATFDGGVSELITGTTTLTFILSYCAAELDRVFAFQKAPISGSATAVYVLFTADPCKVKLPAVGSKKDAPSFRTNNCHVFDAGV